MMRMDETLRASMEGMPVIDTHEHFDGPTPRYDNPVRFLMTSYFFADYATVVASARNLPEDPLERFLAVYEKAKHTGFARAMLRGVKRCYGIQSIDRASINALGEALSARDDTYFANLLAREQIRAAIIHRKGPANDIEPFYALVDGREKGWSDVCRYTIPITPMIDLQDAADMRHRARGASVTCLDEYLQAITAYIEKCVRFGAVAMKDYLAYRRDLRYTLPTRDDAERAFNKLLTAQRAPLGEEDRRVLGDYLTHHMMRLAARYALPVQVHTGHLIGQRNDIRDANAIELVPLMEVHPDVRFDLFHANWPYLDEAMFIGKNYANTYLNLCWTQSLDPLYSVQFLRRALMALPINRIIAFGGDTRQSEWIAGNLEIAKDNVADALTGLMEDGALDRADAESISRAIFFDTPNELYNLHL